MKKTVLLSIAFIFFHFMGYSQQRIPVKSSLTRINDAYSEKISFTGIRTGLEARFTADIRSGVRPLTVQFTDESLGNPVSWLWDFGDSGTSAEQNPSHVFLTEGKYSVKLTISDGSNTYTLEKENYITVLLEQPACDTLDFPFAGTYTYYLVTGDNTGYVSGNNSFGDKAKANYFSAYPEKIEIQGLLLEFAVAVQGSGNTTSVTFALWDNTGAQGAPGAIRKSASIPLSQIVEDVSENTFTYVPFDDPLYITAPFYAGVILPSSSGDTVALWTNTDGDAASGIGWEQWSDDGWLPYSDAELGWNLKIANAIFPVVCASSQGREELLKAEDILIYPNPATDKVTLRFNNPNLSTVKIKLYNIMGGLMDSFIINPLQTASSTISLQGYTKGLYFMILETGNQKITRKIHVV
ncbi:MAG TPA: PKD domain-containing protein [Bacteroidales bacterium]|nr:PKD domain-containing protein [Bacteroidales bacterium]HNS47523.1 PKD domain-containing protein [Bacteroidales bacterium]